MHLYLYSCLFGSNCADVRARLCSLLGSGTVQKLDGPITMQSGSQVREDNADLSASAMKSRI